MDVSVIEAFLERTKSSDLGPAHLSLFMALYALSLDVGIGVTFRLTRRKLMAFSRLRSPASYHRKMSDLVRMGIIEYEPSYHPRLGSKVRFL